MECEHKYRSVSQKQDLYGCTKCDSIISGHLLIPYLQSELAQLRESQRWVSVEERLPVNDGSYLVVEDGEVYHDERVGSEWRSNKPELCCITHWMPLPSPPGAQDQDA